MLNLDDFHFLENWMSVMKDQIYNTPMKNLRIPSSHDSNTFRFQNSPIAPFARCQSMPILNQLNYGIRMIDLRYGPNESMPGIQDAIYRNIPIIVDQHGPLSGQNFLTHLDEALQFLKTHPDEFLFINIQWEKQMSVLFNQYLIDEIVRRFALIAVTANDLSTWFQIEKVTYGDILEHSKRVLIVTRKSLWENSIYSEAHCADWGLHDQEKYIHSTWHDCGNPDELLQKNSTEIFGRDTNPELKSKFLCSQIIITLQGKIGYIFKNIFSGTIPSINSLNNKLHKKKAIHNFLFWVIKNKKGNLFMFDFIETDTSLLLMLIASNGNAKLNIQKLMVGEFSKMDCLSNLTLDKTIFYIPKAKDFMNKLNMKNHELFVVYNFGMGAFRVRTFGREQTCLIYYNRLAEQRTVDFYSYFIFINSGKFTVQAAESQEAFHRMSKEILSESNIKQGFWIPGKFDFSNSPIQE